MTGNCTLQPVAGITRASFYILFFTSWKVSWFFFPQDNQQYCWTSCPLCDWYFLLPSRKALPKVISLFQYHLVMTYSLLQKHERMWHFSIIFFPRSSTLRICPDMYWEASFNVACFIKKKKKHRKCWKIRNWYVVIGNDVKIFFEMKGTQRISLMMKAGNTIV